MNNTQESIDRVCGHRGMSSVKKGTECEVDGKAGIIVGGNLSSNFNVLFDDSRVTSNCHPGWRMKIFNPFGGVSYISEDIDGQGE